MKMAERRQGGMRTPRNPAPVSAPGALSRRTDGGPQQTNPRMSGMAYGENQDFEDMQSSAPMSASRTAGRASSAARAKAPQGPSATPLFGPTQRPDEPVTAGAPFGPGDGPSRQMNNTEQSIADAKMIGKYLPDLMSMADQPDTPDGFRRFVRHLRNIQGA